MQEARRCDLVLVAGSSLEVTPAADIPFLAVDSGAKAIIVNLEPTAFDTRADVVIHGDVTEILPRLVETVSAMGGN
jgi:NAD-dependent deacetylase